MYNEVCRTCGYENFLRLPGGARIERKDAEGEGFSQLSFAQDRIQVIEDHTGTSVDEFAKKLHAVLSVALPRLGIPIILIQQNTVRVTANPNNYRTAGEYFARSVFRMGSEDLEMLSRPVNVFGFRLVLPATAQCPENYHLRIESYVRDPRTLYVENVGQFKTPIQPTNLELVGKNLRTTSDFLIEKVLPFLSAFDRKESG